jgi:anti-sigma factor RsiW
MTGRLPFVCADALRRLDDYVDRHLDATEVHQVEAHLAVCDVCASKFRFERRLISELRRTLRRLELPAGLADRIRARLIHAVEGNGVA